MAVPGSIKSAASLGTNRLIQEGAYLVTNAEDVLSFLRQDNEYIPDVRADETRMNLTLEESLVLNSLMRCDSIEDICNDLNQVPVHRIMALISSLEVKGLITSLPGGKYVTTLAGQKLSI